MAFKPMEGEQKFWLVWVDESGNPRKRCKSLEIARNDAQRLRDSVTQRNVFIMECVEKLEGRVVIAARARHEKNVAETQKVE